MNYDLVATGDNTCQLTEVTPSSSAEWPLPYSKAFVQDAISEMLLQPDDIKHLEREGLLVEVMRESVRLIIGGASFDIKWRYVFGLLA